MITVDVHSERAKRLFPIPMRSLSPATVFAEALNRHGLTEATIVAPDEGAIGRCEAVQKAAGIASGKIPYFEKQRTATGITHAGPIGQVGREAVIVDDIWTPVALCCLPAKSSSKPEWKRSPSWLLTAFSLANDGRSCGGSA